MGKRLMMNVLVLLVMVVLQAGDVPAAGAEQQTLARSACKEIASLAKKFSGLNVKESVGTVHDGKTGSDRDGCRILATTDHAQYRDGEWPHEIVKMRMMSDQWREDLHRCADGAGSTAFAVRKGAAMCTFSAIWCASDSSESEPAVDEYRLEIGCFEVDEAD